MMSDMKILCMYSGGLDSCGALWELLTNEQYANDTILVHHVNILNHENRFYPEKIAVEKTLAAIKNQVTRPFYYSESTIDFQFLPIPSDIPYDGDCYAFIAGNLAVIDPAIGLIATGSTLTDENDDGGAVRRMGERRQAVFDTLFMHREREKRCQIFYPVGTMTKAQIWAMLPDDVRQHTWSCRRPVFHQKTESGMVIEACRQCATCLEIMTFNDEARCVQV
jgi:hypothetical protein